MAVVGVTLVTVTVAALVYRQARGPGRKASDDDSRGDVMLSSEIMVCDPSGRGALSAVVKTTALHGNEVVPSLTTFEARSGKRLRTIDLLGSLGGGPIACFGAIAIEATKTSLVGYDLAAGKRLWQTPLPERVDKFCAHNHGTGASFLADDKQTYRVNLATGELSAGSKDASPCSRPPSIDNYINAGPGVDQWWQTDILHTKDNVEGMAIRELWSEGAAPILLAMGDKWPGSHTPMIAALTKEGALLWKAELASKNPLGFGSQKPSVSLRDGRVITSFLHEVDEQYVVGSWELATGRRRWEVTIPRKIRVPSRNFMDPSSVPIEQSCQGLAQTDQQIFVACTNTLLAYGIEDGKLLWSQSGL